LNINEIRKMWHEEWRVPENLSTQEIIQFWNEEFCHHSRKVQTVLEYGSLFRINTLIETGTYHGDMIQATLHHFSKIFSIELEPTLFFKAKHKFSGYSHISIIPGDSGMVLPRLLRLIHEPCLFWLDGHYNPFASDTARGVLDTPILLELKAILEHSIKNHVILIDDARCFIGPNPILRNYPTIDQLKEFVARRWNNFSFEVKDDIIRIILL
jgi:hypothetical protein